MSIDVRLLREALRIQPTGDEQPVNDLSIEKMGDEAFDWLLGELRRGDLTPPESIRALRLMARITRQFCVRRKGELLDLALALAQSPSPDRDVRSAAVHVAILNTGIAKRLQDASAAYGRSVHEVYVEVSQAARRAAELGVTPEIDTFIKAFLSTSESQPAAPRS